MGLGSDVVRVSVDSSDIQAIERQIETRFQAAQGDAFGMQWRDEGYWLLFPLALLGLLWFRRGTTVAWVVDVVRRHAGLACKSAGTAAPFCRPVADAGPAGTDCV